MYNHLASGVKPRHDGASALAEQLKTDGYDEGSYEFKAHHRLGPYELVLASKVGDEELYDLAWGFCDGIHVMHMANAYGDNLEPMWIALMAAKRCGSHDGNKAAWYFCRAVGLLDKRDNYNLLGKPEYKVSYGETLDEIREHKPNPYHYDREIWEVGEYALIRRERRKKDKTLVDVFAGDMWLVAVQGRVLSEFGYSPEHALAIGIARRWGGDGQTAQDFARVLGVL